MTERITIEQAAQELGTTALALLMQIKRKHLEGVEIEGKWYVSRESLSAFQKAEHAPTAHICRGGCANPGGCSSKP